MGTFLVKMEHVPVFQVKIEIFMTSRNDEINNNMIQKIKACTKRNKYFFNSERNKGQIITH